MIYGYAGNILNVNLSTEELSTENLDASRARGFLGGLGFSIRVLYDEVGPEVDALDSANVIVIASGALTATRSTPLARTRHGPDPAPGSVFFKNSHLWHFRPMVPGGRMLHSSENLRPESCQRSPSSRVR